MQRPGRLGDDKTRFETDPRADPRIADIVFSPVLFSLIACLRFSAPAKAAGTYTPSQPTVFNRRWCCKPHG